MMCRKCGCETFTVVKVFRNRIRKDNKWVFDREHDTRLHLCDDCGRRYYSPTALGIELDYDFENFRKKEIGLFD